MAFEKPALKTLRETAEADTASRFGLSALLPRSVLLVLSRVLAGLAHGLYGHLSWISRQILPDTADADGLVRYASIFGINRKASSPATGSATVTGLEGTLLPGGTLLRRSDGVEYAIDGAQTITLGGGGTVEALVVGLAGGTTENSPTGTQLTFTEPIEGVQSIATVVAPGLTNGDDLETDVDLLARLLVRLQNPPQGGAKADYLAWALEVPGVTRAYVFPNHLGAGTVGVTFAVDNDPGGPIPSAAQVTELQNYLDDDTRRPVTASVTVFAPTPELIPFTLTLTPDDPAVRAAVEANLEDLVEREAGPGATLLLTHIAETISTTPGEIDHSITWPAADVVVGAGELGTFAGITWV